MSSILYYSKYCEVCKKYLQLLSRSQVQQSIHFICIDQRFKDAQGKTRVVLPKEQTVILPDTVTRVPALLLLNEGYRVLFGEQILEHLRPRQEEHIRQATQNNMEPMAFSFGSGGGASDIVSDSYSFLDQTEEELKTTGNGGMRQMHNYMDINRAYDPNQMNQMAAAPEGETRGRDESSANKMMEDRLAKIKAERDADIRAPKFGGGGGGPGPAPYSGR